MKAKIFKIGDYAYTSKQINGWFDYALEKAIPPNTICKIKKIVSQSDNIDAIVYEVEFNEYRQFATFHVKHDYLKLV